MGVRLALFFWKPQLAERLTQEFERSFAARNLLHMRSFFQPFPVWDAVRTELSWTHYWSLLWVGNKVACERYFGESMSHS